MPLASTVKKATKDDLPYVCQTCNKSFSSRSTLLRHSRTIHGFTKNFDCEFCCHTIARQDTLRRHMLSVHKDRLAVSSPMPQCSPVSSLYPTKQPGYNEGYLRMLEVQAPTMSMISPAPSPATSPVHCQELYSSLPSVPASVSPAHSTCFSEMELDCSIGEEEANDDQELSIETSAAEQDNRDKQPTPPIIYKPTPRPPYDIPSPMHHPGVEAYSPFRPSISPPVKKPKIFNLSTCFPFKKPNLPKKRKSTNVPATHTPISAPPLLMDPDLNMNPSNVWPRLVSEIHDVRFEALDDANKVLFHLDPSLFFLGAPSSFAPTHQARILSAIRAEAVLSGEYLGTRHIPLNVMCVRKVETARLQDGTIYEMSCTWTFNPDPERMTRETSSQTEPTAAQASEVTHL